MKDLIYSTPQQQVADFQFDENVVEVFPDMIQRSVPGYATILSTITQLTEQFAKDNTHLYDLGCSLGAATLSMRKGLGGKNCKLIAVDNSQAMVDRCKTHLQGFVSNIDTQVICSDINDVEITNASVVVLNFTLQFVPPEQRLALMEKIADGLKPGGILILSEKLRAPQQKANEVLVELHHQFKRQNGYSELEISQKRTALENVMKTDTLDIHENRCISAGFSSFTQWFQCFNFSSMVAIK